MTRRLPAVASSLEQAHAVQGETPCGSRDPPCSVGHPKSAQELFPEAAARVAVIARFDPAIQ
jgi:hypothetical protein